MNENDPGYIRPAAEMSADDAEKVKRARLLAKVKVLRETPRTINDVKVEGSPDNAYCWVYDHPQMISEYERLGYDVVRAANGKTVQSKWRRPDGTHKRGDTILMVISKEDAEALEVFSAVSAIEQVSSAKSQFTDFAQGSSIPIFQR